MTAPTLYLDQNYMSNLAKARYLTDWENEDREYWEALLEILLELTSDGRLLCPASFFHDEESERGEHVRDIVWAMAEDLGKGLSFRHWTDVVFDNFETAAMSYAGQIVADEPDWAIPFNRNPAMVPESHNGTDGAKFRVKISFTKDVIDYSRDTEEFVLKKYSEFKNSMQNVDFDSFEDMVANMKLLLIGEVMKPPEHLEIGNANLDNLFTFLGGAENLRRFERLFGILKAMPSPADFFTSKELLECDFVHIRSSLMAADIAFYPEKVPDRGMNTDFNIVATVLPYINMLATDAYVKELIGRSGLGERYPVSVYSARRNDRLQLLEKLKSLTV